jgi:O-antigen ligase
MTSIAIPVSRAAIGLGGHGHLPRAGVVAVCGAGVILAAVLALTGSPKLYLAAVAALPVGVAMLLQPRLGMYLTIASVPLEAAGRFGSILPNINLTFAKAFALATLAAWIIHIGARRMRFVWVSEMWALVAYAAFGGLSLFDTREFELGYQALIRYVSTALFYILIVNLIRTRQQFKTALALFVMVSVFTFGFAIAQRYLPGFAFAARDGWDREGAQTFGVEMATLDAGSFETVARSSGVSFHAIILAVNTDFIVPILLALLLISRGIWVQTGIWLTIAVCVAANLTAYSRTGVVILAIMLPIFVARKLLKITPLHVVAVAIVGLCAIPFLPESFIGRILSVKSYTVGGSESLRDRVDLLKAGWNAFLAHPLNGVGMETTYRIFDYYDYPDQGAVITVHNGYLQIMLELGIPGILSVLALYWLTYRRFRRAEDLFRADHTMQLLTRALGLSFVAYIVAGFTLDFMRIGFRNMWTIMAFAPVLYLIAQREASSRSSNNAAG